MRKRVEYLTIEDRNRIIQEHPDYYLVEEQNISEGNFLIFSDSIEKEIVYTDVPQEIFESLQQENNLLKAQNQALTERADFIEDVVAEMATQVYQ